MSEQRFDGVLNDIAEKCMPRHTCIIPHGQYQLLEKSKNDDGSFSVKIKSPAYSNEKLVGHFIASINGVSFKDNGDIIIYENVPISEEVKNRGCITFTPL